MARPGLTRALESICTQQYESLETLVVDAKGGGQADIAAIGGIGDSGAKLILQGKPLSRAAAANVGLQAAANECVIFLDDDDFFEPGHLQDLARTLSEHPDCDAAYCGTRILLKDGSRVAEFNFPFNRVNLLNENFLVIHSVLFRRGLLANGAGFDESLDVYEDWDFWIQLSMQTNFAHSGKINATYIADVGVSGMGLAGNRDQARQDAQRAAIHAKWAAPFAALRTAFESARTQALAARDAGRSEEFNRWQRELIDISRGARGLAIAAEYATCNGSG